MRNAEIKTQVNQVAAEEEAQRLRRGCVVEIGR